MMKAVFQTVVFLLAGALTAPLAAQVDDLTTGGSTFTLDDEPAGEQPGDNIFLKPVNDITERTTVGEKRILPYEHIREADIMWQKRIWRVLDVREKINLPFSNPQRPLITILMDAYRDGKIQLYSTIDDKFETPVTPEDMAAIAGGVDTVPIVDPETYDVTYELRERELNPADIKRYRLQEVWFFDKESSTFQVRILGIAPLKDEYDENGNFLYELPMFWVYYPGARQVLANEQAYVFGNDAANRSWEDIFESRYFNSYIFKESNVLDRRIGGYLTSGRDKLMEAERIKQEIFNFEHDLWSY